MTPEIFYQRLLQSDISSEHLKRIYEMVLFERDKDKTLSNDDLQSIKKLYDLIGLLAETEIDFENAFENLGDRE